MELKMPSQIEINRSEEGLFDGQIAKVIDVVVDQGESDYRVITQSGEEFWIPSENTTIID